APRLRGYTRESVVAEKFQAMVALGEVNSRLKDFYDVWFLAQRFDFEAAVLVAAVGTAFARRGTDLPRAPRPLAEGYGQDDRRSTQWRAFLRRSGMEDVPLRFPDVVEALRAFLQPVVDAIHTAAAPRALGTWRAAEGWTPRAGE